MILFFSGNGNSAFVAHELSRLTGDRLLQINPLDNAPSIQLEEDEPLGIVCPVYAWAVPRLVDDYLARLKTNKAPSYCYLACTCGDNVGRTPERLAKTLARRQWKLNAAFSFVMPETYINLPGFKLDTEDNARRKIEAVKERLPLVASQIMERKEIIDVVRGPMPRFNSYFFNPLFYGLIITDSRFLATDDCIACGLCAKNCPLSNITMEQDRPTWHGNCTNCMACYHHCPKNAIHFGKATLGKGQYFFNFEL